MGGIACLRAKFAGMKGRSVVDAEDVFRVLGTGDEAAVPGLPSSNTVIMTT